jgi:anti-sigma regulatory factor (Ser/Thr protein kinase)
MTAVHTTPREYRGTHPAEPVSVPRIRHTVRDTLAQWGLGRDHPLVETVLVVCSELVTNCVRHAAVTSPQVDVRLELRDEQLVVSVHDRHPYRPSALLAPHQHGLGGRGLFLVQQLTAEAGGSTSVPPDADGGGKTVVVVLPL